VSVSEWVSGRMLHVDETVHGLNFSLINVYVRNGDFNCTINHTLDRNHEEPHKQSSEELKPLITYRIVLRMFGEMLSLRLNNIAG